MLSLSVPISLKIVISGKKKEVCKLQTSFLYFAPLFFQTAV